MTGKSRELGRFAVQVGKFYSSLLIQAVFIVLLEQSLLLTLRYGICVCFLLKFECDKFC